MGVNGVHRMDIWGRISFTGCFIGGELASLDASLVKIGFTEVKIHGEISFPTPKSRIPTFKSRITIC